MRTLLRSWKLGLDAPASHPRRSSPCLDPAKRLEAYLAAEGVPLEAEAIRSFLATECDLHHHYRRSGNVQARSASSTSRPAPGDVVGQIRTFGGVLWHWLGFEVLAIIPEMPRHAPIPG